MPVTLPYTLTNNTPADADQVMADFNALLAGINAQSSLDTALPGSPVDGQECFFSTGVAGVIWHLRYRTSEAKWAFLGGADLFAEVATQSSTSSLSYVALGSAGPAVALPLAGDYDVEIGAYMSHNQPSGLSWMSYDIGGTAAVDADSVLEQQPSAGASGLASGARLRRKTGLTAVTLTAKYKITTAGTANFLNRWMRVRPVRLG